MFRSLLLSACLCLSQGTPPAASEDPLEALVKKTNALEGFTARYRITDREGVVSNITLSYAAPDRAALSRTGDDGSSRMWLVDGEMCFDYDERGGSHHFGRMNSLELLESGKRFVDVRLREDFPGPLEEEPNPLGAGIVFTWDWPKAKAGEKPMYYLAANLQLQRSHVCEWLKTLERRSKTPRETEDAFVWELEEVEVELSKETGFIARARSKDPGSKGETVLLSLELEPASDEAVFAAPRSAPEGAIDDSAEMKGGTQRQILNETRKAVWLKLAKWIDDEKVTWDEHSPEKLTNVFRDLHADPIGDSMKQHIQKMRDWIDTAVEDLAARARALDPGDHDGLLALTAQRDRVLDDWSADYASRMKAFAEKLPPPASVPADLRMSDVFLECERAAVRAEYKAQVIDPLLALFRERTDAALGR